MRIPGLSGSVLSSSLLKLRFKFEKNRFAENREWSYKDGTTIIVDASSFALLRENFSLNLNIYKKLIC